MITDVQFIYLALAFGGGVVVGYTVAVEKLHRQKMRLKKAFVGLSNATLKMTENMDDAQLKVLRSELKDIVTKVEGQINEEEDN